MWRTIDDCSAGSVRRARMTVVAVLALPAMLVAGCDDSPTDPDPTVSWAATLSGEGEYEDVAGEADATSTATSFEIEVSITDAAADAEYVWWVAEGTCETPDEIVGEGDDYPALTTNGEGAASAEATVAAALDEEGDYHVSVRVADDENTVVACGSLVAG